MAIKGKKAAKKSGASRRKSGAPKSAKADQAELTGDALHDSSRTTASDFEQYTRGVIIRGEAAYPSSDGTLSHDATHVIIGEDERGIPLIREHRKKAF